MQAVVVHEEHQRLTGMQHQRGAGDVSRAELIAREGRGAVMQQAKGQFRALPRQIVGAGVERPNDLYCGGSLPSCSLVHTRSGSSCIDFVNASRA